MSNHSADAVDLDDENRREDWNNLYGHEEDGAVPAEWRPSGHQNRDYEEPQPALRSWDIPSLGPASVNVGREEPSSLPDPNFAEQFLAQDIDELKKIAGTKDTRIWTGKKLLGKGNMGVVGLWECSSRSEEETKKIPLKVAVKEPADDGDIDEEQMLKRLNTSNSPHIVRLFEPAGRKRDKHRLILEYCPLGDMQGLLKQRRTMSKRFDEITLWRLFDCLVDGLMVLTEGIEYNYNAEEKKFYAKAALLKDDAPAAAKRKFNTATRKHAAHSSKNDKFLCEGEWNTILNFDLKPDNLLLGDRNHDHTWTPMADPGVAWAWIEKRNQNPQWQFKMRQNGTPGYHTPEQVSEKWDFKDWNETGVAGQYGPNTNVWSVGWLMFEFLTLLDLRKDVNFPMQQRKAFMPTWDIADEPAEGRTYGEEMITYRNEDRYSASLIDLIWQCLYEEPAKRPSPRDLRIRVDECHEIALQAAIRSGRVGEPWEDLFPPREAAEVGEGNGDDDGEEDNNDVVEPDDHLPLASAPQAVVEAQAPAQVPVRSPAQSPARLPIQAQGQPPTPPAQPQVPAQSPPVGRRTGRVRRPPARFAPEAPAAKRRRR
ncbi:kinase-like domain-containing protein [Amylocarpus encephaloides]|uniref:Kinase-like domain-containing protein n=1 Tax=Amylocarpus encephaloides TaxID=45428 RepID=A0A9P7YF78_9HELO|nr:kinase-like domain-containing protein [Amylocarpus encephaloides]